MASASTSNQSIDSNNASLSHFQKTVCLQDWWLIKVETDIGEKRLAIAGFTSGEQQARRVFSSAPIHRRFDVFTLETVDGIFIIIKGFINKVRTEENGFPAEVFNHFVFGFPPYWEEYAEKCFGGGFTNEAVSRSNLSHDKLSTHSGAVAGTKDYSEATPKKNEKLIGEESHGSDKMDVGLEDSGIILSAMEQHSLRDGSCNKVSLEITKACPSQDVPKIIIGDALKSSDLHNNVTDFLSCVEDETIVDIGSSSSIGVKGTIGRCSLTSKDEGQDDQLKSAVANVESESGGKSILNVSNAGFQEPTDDITDGMEGENTKESVKSSIRIDGAIRKDVDKKESNAKEANASRKKTKRKLTYGSPIIREQKEKESVVSPGSLSFKRSRSGRLLLPTLEFWRNQTAIYDADRHITGIQEGLLAVKSSRGSRSEPQRKRKQLR
ncbi:kinetochore-associated protein KNL-2 homolog [Cornus florida]|uniref:kinetochore-associated protein KNL-2 homolog n=1 Tax=Cornus florida TaxID=4283 RepID=UPI00289CD5F7|nr:kinetochore-associated protein KNL-2 homolog [Cornus florida]XP_059667805.1 kinetochore-associated protein KNL-2 homolog [Cornus florida]